MDFIGNRTIDLLAREHARDRPEQPFLSFESSAHEVTELSYAEFDRQTRSLVRTLYDAGLTEGDRVCVLLRNSIAIVVVLYACARARLIGVPVNVHFAADEVRHVLELTEPAALISDTEFVPVLDRAARRHGSVRLVCTNALGGENSGWSLGSGCIGASWHDLVSAPDASTPALPRSTDPVQMIMTSGTTAWPKAVVRTDRNWLLSGYRFAHQARMVASDRSMTALPAFHVNCLDQTLMATFSVGGTVVLLERYSASRLIAQARAHGATVLSVVPMLIRTILAQERAAQEKDHAIRLVLGGLHITEEELYDFCSRFGVDILNGYGLTEACTNVTLWPYPGDRRWPSIGLPAFDREVSIVADDGIEVATGEVGEIAVRGTPGRDVMLGYYNDEAATTAALRDGWLYTGDLARADADGYLYFVDRKKDMIKVAGENVAASEVERVLSGHPRVQEVAVIGVPDPLRDEAVMAVVVPSVPPGPELEELRSYCAGRLAAFKLPTCLKVVDELPRGAIGKVNKGVLREAYGRDRGAAA